MPGPILQDPTPSWMRPENASVLDPWYVKAARAAGRLIGADDPASQLFALGAPMQVPKGTLGGLAAKTAEKATMPGGSLQELKNYIKAYHGSPHDFERFDLSKIGTGEGAQAYGHGLYFAEHEPVARQYRDQLRWRGADWNDPATIAQNAVDTHGGWDKGLEALRTARDANLKQAGKVQPELVDAIKMMETQNHIEATPPKPGRMYEVAIKADPEHFLDWDKPLSQQSEHVKNVLRQIDPERMDMIRNKSFDITGSKFHDDLWEKAIGDPKATEKMANAKLASVTQRLKDAGIKGIKYLDQGSRGAGEGSRNYVVFDDKTIDILKKYGLLPPAVGLGAAASQQQ
jgi:hypothetical protein